MCSFYRKKCDKRLDLLALVSGKCPTSMGFAWCRFHCIHLSGRFRVTLSPSTLNGGQRKDSKQNSNFLFVQSLEMNSMQKLRHMFHLNDNAIGFRPQT